MNNEKEREVRNSKNSFELEGNVANINNIYTNQNGKKMLRFDLAQNNNGNTQYVPIVLRGELVNTYGNEIQKGDWISVKGNKDKAIDILGFEITDRKNNKVYTSDGQVQELKDKSKDEMER